MLRDHHTTITHVVVWNFIRLGGEETSRLVRTIATCWQFADSSSRLCGSVVSSFDFFRVNNLRFSQTRASPVSSPKFKFHATLLSLARYLVHFFTLDPVEFKLPLPPSMDWPNETTAWFGNHELRLASRSCPPIEARCRDYSARAVSKRRKEALRRRLREEVFFIFIFIPFFGFHRGRSSPASGPPDGGAHDASQLLGVDDAAEAF